MRLAALGGEQDETDRGAYLQCRPEEEPGALCWQRVVRADRGAQLIAGSGTAAAAEQEEPGALCCQRVVDRGAQLSAGSGTAAAAEQEKPGALCWQRVVRADRRRAAQLAAVWHAAVAVAAAVVSRALVGRASELVEYRVILSLCFQVRLQPAAALRCSDLRARLWRCATRCLTKRPLAGLGLSSPAFASTAHSRVSNAQRPLCRRCSRGTRWARWAAWRTASRWRR